MTRLRTPNDSVFSPKKPEEPAVATLDRRQLLQGAAAVGVIGASRAMAPGWMPRLAFRSPGMLANGAPVFFAAVSAFLLSITTASG